MKLDEKKDVIDCDLTPTKPDANIGLIVMPTKSR